MPIFRYLNKHRELIPLAMIMTTTLSGMVYTGIRALRRSDIIIDRWHNPEPWEKVDPTQPQKVTNLIGEQVLDYIIKNLEPRTVYNPSEMGAHPRTGRGPKSFQGLRSQPFQMTLSESSGITSAQTRGSKPVCGNASATFLESLSIMLWILEEITVGFRNRPTQDLILVKKRKTC